MLNGVFAFVGAHDESKTVVIARDPIGVTPLYYAVQDHILHVSSLLKRFLAVYNTSRHSHRAMLPSITREHLISRATRTPMKRHGHRCLSTG